MFELCLGTTQSRNLYSVLSCDEGNRSSFQNVVAEETWDDGHCPKYRQEHIQNSLAHSSFSNYPILNILIFPCIKHIHKNRRISYTMSVRYEKIRPFFIEKPNRLISRHVGM
jgi:hypothetical protein